MRKSDDFKRIYISILTGLAVTASVFMVVFILILYGNAKLEDVKIEKIRAMEAVYMDDYTKAITLDNVVIEKGEDIVVKLDTTSYSLKTRFDANGVFVETKISAKYSGAEYFVSALLGTLSGLAVFYILYAPFCFIYPAMVRKEDLAKKEEEEKEAKRKEKERMLAHIDFIKQFPLVYKDELAALEEEERAKIKKENDEKTEEDSKDQAEKVEEIIEAKEE